MKAQSDDLLTLTSIGVCAFVACDLGHEMLGHGGVCLVTGGRAASFSTVHFQCFGGFQSLITASGILFNLVTGMIAYLLLRRMHAANIYLRYFVWLFALFSLLTGWYYMAQSSFANTGDWANFLRLAAAANWRFATGSIAAILVLASGWALTRELRFFIGSADLSRTWRLATIPFWTLALLPPLVRLIHSHWTLGQAAGVVFGSAAYAAGFLAIPLAFRVRLGRHLPEEAQPGISRSTPWILLGAAVLGVFVFVFGPGITLIRG